MQVCAAQKKTEAFTFRLKFHHYHPGFWAPLATYLEHPELPPSQR